MCGTNAFQPACDHLVRLWNLPGRHLERVRLKAAQEGFLTAGFVGWGTSASLQLLEAPWVHLKHRELAGGLPGALLTWTRHAAIQHLISPCPVLCLVREVWL